MSDTSQLQLFISHASEDKPSFVRPLAEALKVHFKIWYDEYELTMGDSLLGKINTGLASCDYGVVVLSPAFFQKKWPKAELDGLFALEQGSRKVILPIWKDIDEKGVANFSPILAGRLAVPASDGIDRVVAEIKRAVGVTERVREFSQFDALELRMKRLALNLATRSTAEQKLRTIEGVREIDAEELKLCQLLQIQFEKVATAFTQLKCSFHRDVAGFQIHGPFRLRMGVKLDGHRVNDATDTRLKSLIFQMGKRDDFMELRPQPLNLKERTFRPYFGHEAEPVWTSPNSTEEFMTTQQVALLLAENFIEFIERESRKP